MKGFNKTTIGEILTFQRGFDITKKEQTPGEIPIVSSSGVNSYHNKFKVNGPGVIIGRKGTLGTVHYIKDRFWPHDTTLWVKDFKGNNPRFIYYFLKTLHLEAFDTGASNPTLNRNHLHKIKVIFPELKIQKKITAILSTYDDLIENNKRRIALLEKMVEETYREWFVRFRFPGYKNAKFEKGLPEGWEIKNIKSIVARKKFGKIYREKELNNEGKIIVIDQSKDDYLGFYDGEPQHKASAENPMILFGDHTCKMVLIMRDFALAENVIPLLPKDEMPVLFLFYLIKDKAKTTEYKRHWTELTTQKVLIPNNCLQIEYSEKVAPFYQQIDILKNVISNLYKTVDNLLPRFISGKLSVEELDIQFPPSMLEEETAA